MRAFVVSLLVAALTAFGGGGSNAQRPSAEPAELPPWHVPDIASLPDDGHGREVRYGHDLILHTSALIGPDARDPAMRFAGNGLECRSCHRDGGTVRFGLPFVGIWSLYPAFSARSNAMETMEGRINDCMQRSMNGRPLPPASREMAAIEAYFRFLGSEQPDKVAPVGRGAPRLPLPEKAADPVHGASVYRQVCAACHGAHGAGVRYPALEAARKQQRYLFPPLWGPDSYNDGAGMSHNIGAAWFVHANMPRGVNFDHPLLSTTNAYDVVAFVNAQPRPHMADLAHDYPDPWIKPADVATPPYLGPFPARQHEFGPWQPIQEWLRQNAPKDGGGPRSGGDLEAATETGAIPAK
jgi:thiosulfate dehydrogenase